MRCPHCLRSMRALFTSYACDFCDGLAEVLWQRGFIVFRGEDDFARPVYVFPTRTDAAVYRRLNEWQGFPIREVHFELPVAWRPAAGKLQGVTIAARPFALHRDHRFAPAPYAAYLVPLSRLDAVA